MFMNQIRDIAQLGRAPALGAGGRRFKSYYPDYSYLVINKKLNSQIYFLKSIDRI